jgi:hypothetical protein
MAIPQNVASAFDQTEFSVKDYAKTHTAVILTSEDVQNIAPGTSQQDLKAVEAMIGKMRLEGELGDVDETNRAVATMKEKLIEAMDKSDTESTRANKKMLDVLSEQLKQQRELVKTGKNTISKDDIAALESGLMTTRGAVATRGQTDEDIRKENALASITYGIGKFGRDLFSGEGTFKERAKEKAVAAKDFMTGGEKALSVKGIMNMLGKAIPAAGIAAGAILEADPLMLGSGIALNQQVKKERALKERGEAEASAEGEVQRSILEQAALGGVNEIDRAAAGEEVEKINRKAEAKGQTGPAIMADADEDTYELLYLKLDDIFGVNKEIRDIAEMHKNEVVEFNQFQRDVMTDALLARDEKKEEEEETQGKKEEKDKDEENALMELGKAGVMLATLGGLAIAKVVGDFYNDTFEKWWGPGGLGGKLFDLFGGDDAPTHEEALTEGARVTDVGMTGTTDEVDAERERIKKEIARLEEEKTKDESTWIGRKLAWGDDEAAAIAELTWQLKALNRTEAERKDQAEVLQDTSGKSKQQLKQEAVEASEMSQTRAVQAADLATEKRKEAEGKEPVIIQQPAPQTGGTPQAPGPTNLSSGDMKSFSNQLNSEYPIGS